MQTVLKLNVKIYFKVNRRMAVFIFNNAAKYSHETTECHFLNLRLPHSLTTSINTRISRTSLKSFICIYNIDTQNTKLNTTTVITIRFSWVPWHNIMVFFFDTEIEMIVVQSTTQSGTKNNIEMIFDSQIYRNIRIILMIVEWKSLNSLDN